MTNREFSKTDQIFLKSCEIAWRLNSKFKPTVRQASKFRMEKGTAFQFRAVARRELNLNIEEED